MDNRSDGSRSGASARGEPAGRILDGSRPDPRFERIARLAARYYGAPRAAVTLVDGDTLWVKASVGLDASSWPRRNTLADRAFELGDAVISGDITADTRFAGADAWNGAKTRFYAAARFVDGEGRPLGIVSVGADEPRPDAAEADLATLIDLAALAGEELARDAERLGAREQHRVDSERVDLALQAAGLGAFEWDMATDKVFVSERLSDMTGGISRIADGERGAVSYRFVHPDDREPLREKVDASVRATGRYDVEYRIVRPDDNRVRWMRGWGAVVDGADGKPAKILGVVQDITDRKLEDEQRETLLAELDHRVKNVLAAVQSLAAQSARKTVSLDSFLKTFAGRLKAMASAHELLTATRWRGAAVGDIVTAELSGLAPGQARWEGPEIFLSPRAANALSLALHELATNAVKYGALSVETGRIEVNWKGLPEGGFGLDWREMGGPSVSPPTRRGFGSTLLEQVTGRELGGAAVVDYRPDGVRARITADGHALVRRPADTDAPVIQPPDPELEGRPEGHIVETFTGASRGAAEAAAGVAGLKLLIVEDAVLLALELEAGLTDAGADVLGCAAELEEAMGMLGLPIDAAVLDANLNGKSVAPVAEALQARGTPFVFATGYGDGAAPTGFDAPIVRKPYNVHQIIKALGEATGRG